uniref:CSON005209 protein n=1 Tax=Culicoides sonorensis TaxID=179676 RepID=A0A336L6X2_CULSO
MAPSSSSSNPGSENERKVSSPKHKRKEKSHKKTKKRYKHRSDDDERGYKKFKRRKDKKEKRERKNSSDEETVTRPGPSEELITDKKSEIQVRNEISNAAPVRDEPEDLYGPALPPHLMKDRVPAGTSNDTSSSHGSQSKENKEKVIGPALPPHLMQNLTHDTKDEGSHSDSDQQEPKTDHDDDLGDFVGPLPGVVNPELETRALEIKLGHVSSSGQNQSDEKARDEWMLELPEVKGVTDLGLTARQFRTKERPDFSDRSHWTDTPSDKERKKQGKPSAKELAKEEERQRERQALARRDAEQERIAKEHKKKHKRDKSLMDLHEKKLKKAKKEKEKEGPEPRRPFDRNVDLAANRFDEAQKKSIIKKAQLLDTRFSSGASKFL